MPASPIHSGQPFWQGRSAPHSGHGTASNNPYNWEGSGGTPSGFAATGYGSGGYTGYHNPHNNYSWFTGQANSYDGQRDTAAGYYHAAAQGRSFFSQMSSVGVAIAVGVITLGIGALLWMLFASDD